MSAQPGQSESAAGPVAAPPAARSVLIAEDDAVLRGQLADYLTRQGLTCHVAADGTQAIEALERHRPEVALLDIMMPDITGLDVAAIIADLEPRPTLILMTGFDDAARAARQSPLEVFAVIEKPVPLRDVARQVELAFEDRAA